MSTNVEGSPKLSPHRVVRTRSVRYASEYVEGSVPPGFVTLPTASTSTSPAASNSRSSPSRTSCPLPVAVNTNLHVLTGASVGSAAASCGYGDTNANALPVANAYPVNEPGALTSDRESTSDQSDASPTALQYSFHAVGNQLDPSAANRSYAAKDDA